MMQAMVRSVFVMTACPSTSGVVLVVVVWRYCTNTTGVHVGTGTVAVIDSTPTALRLLRALPDRVGIWVSSVITAQ